VKWINLETSMLRAPEFIGSNPVKRATWLCVRGYCCEMENGGRLLAAATWGGRQCQQACGATAREVRSADKLICTEGTDAVVWGYPADRENEVRRLRGETKRGAAAGWRPPAKPLKMPQGIPQGTEQALPVDMPKGNAEL
jgi:hypothetical protein